MEEANASQTFAELLQCWGGNWMWNDVRNSGREFGWVLSVLDEGSCIWITDGSFMEDLRDDVSGAGWKLNCINTGHKLTGSFYEESVQAG